MKLTWFGHSAIRIDSGRHVILIDPFLSGNAKFTGSVEEASRGCTHVVLTHGHDDHVGDAVAICKNTGATLVAAFELGEYLSAQGVQSVELGNPGGTIAIGDGADVSFVKAFHSSSTVVDGRPVYLGHPCGVVLRGLGPVVYHMGDTEIFGDMALINEIFAPKIGCVPIGDRFTMGAQTAAMACKRYFQFDVIVPIHYGTFPIIDQDASKFLEHMAGHNVVVPEIGSPLSL